MRFWMWVGVVASLCGIGLAQQPAVPAGTLSARLTHVSRIYDGMQSAYWIYVPAQYDARTPAALMVFQDGSGYLDPAGSHRR